MMNKLSHIECKKNTYLVSIMNAISVKREWLIVYVVKRNLYPRQPRKGKRIRSNVAVTEYGFKSLDHIVNHATIR